MKITTEKRPRSLLSVQIELDKDRFERGLDQAARRLAQKYPIHGFRPGKAPRFMIERSFGREALVEEASKDLINKAFRDALDQAQIEPIGPASLEEVSAVEPFTFTITVPVAPTIEVGAYRDIRAPLDQTPVSDEQVERMMDVIRDRHVVLKELDEPRPVQEGDQLRVYLDTLVDGELLEPRPEGAEPAEQTLDIVEGRLVDELYAGLLGAAVGDKLELTATLPEDHGNEELRGKDVTFKVEILGMQERLLPDWEELPALENFEGSLDDLRAKTRVDLEASVRNSAERKTIDSYIEQLVAQTSYDVPDVMVEQMAEGMLEDQGRQFARYGITLDQMLQYRGQTREDAIKVLLPDAERQTKITLALQELVRHEGLVISEEEIEAEVARLLLDYDEDQRENVAQLLQSQMRSSVASSVLDRKLRERMLAIATGEVAPIAADEPAPDASVADEPASDASAPSDPAPSVTE